MLAEINSMAIDLPPLAAHPNRAPFRGVLTLVDVPSDSAPAGAQGRRVLLTRAAAERALPSLLGMGLDYAPALDRHDAQRKIGIITEANVVDGKSSRGLTQINADPKQENQRSSAFICGPLFACIEVSGYIFARDFPDILRQLRLARILGQPQFGMSYEITDARVENMRAAVWTITDFTFTGAAILRRDKAAYHETWIELIA